MELRTWARSPCPGILDVDLSRRLDEPEELPWKNRYNILFIVYMVEVRNVSVNIVRECLVPNAWHAVPDEFESRGRWKM